MHDPICSGELERHVLYFEGPSSVPVERIVCFNRLEDDWELWQASACLFMYIVAYINDTNADTMTESWISA